MEPRSGTRRKLKPRCIVNYLTSRCTGRALTSYPRGVDVLWSPTSRAFVVNDYEGSDAAHPVLFSAPWTNQPVDLREKLIGYLRSGR